MGNLFISRIEILGNVSVIILFAELLNNHEIRLELNIPKKKFKS